MTLKNLSLLFAASGIIAGCAQRQPQAQEVSERKTYAEEAEGAAITSEAAKEVAAKDFVEIEFQPNSWHMTESAKSAVKNLVQRSNASGEIDDVLVLSWSDSEYPSSRIEKLSQTQIELATRRNNSIKDYVEDLRSGLDVERYNMAEQPNALAKWLNTTDARLKDTLVAAGLPTTADELQYPSKASHSIVIVKLKQ